MSDLSKGGIQRMLGMLPSGYLNEQFVFQIIKIKENRGVRGVIYGLNVSDGEHLALATIADGLARQIESGMQQLSRKKS